MDIATRTKLESQELIKYSNVAYQILENSKNYKQSKNLISELFAINLGNDLSQVILRLTVIDSYYSTQVGSKRLFGIDDISTKIVQTGTDEELKAKCKSFLSNPAEANEIVELLNGKYGINKMGGDGGKAGSLISKYLYFLMDYEFPIYDSLAIESYPLIKSKYESLELDELSTSFSLPYFEKMTHLKNITGINSYNKLDNLLWLIGKVRKGSIHLILDRERYKSLIRKMNLTKDVKKGVSNNYIDDRIKEYIKSPEKIKEIIKDDSLIIFFEYALSI